MAFGWKMGAPPLPLLLLPLLLMWTGGQAQSGDGDSELRMSCSSHISIHGCSITCQLLTASSSSEDEEEEEEWNGVVRTTMCYSEWSKGGKRRKCVEADGDTVRSEDLSPVLPVNVTVFLQRGGAISSVVNLTKIVRPKSPQVCKVTFDLESNQTVIFIKIPYHNDYLKVENQLFQLHIWTAGQNLIQNISSQDCMKFDMKRLHQGSRYHVKVRSVPVGVLRGSWSEWSETVSFHSPAGPPAVKVEQWYLLTVCLVVLVLVVVASSASIFWKKQILTFIWPIIPHPKQTLVQICKQHKGLLLSLNPEEFSSLNVDRLDRAAHDEELLAPSPQPSSAQSSDCRSTTSVSTEELEISALLSRTSSDSVDSWQNPVASCFHAPGQQQNQQETTLPEGGSAASAVEFRVTQPEEAYVTMSSFYRTK